MSVENVKKFYEAVSKDEALKQKFVELSQKYEGQPMDEAKGMSILEQEALPIAKQLGYEFTMDDLKSFSEEMKQAGMNCELSEEEMQAVAGGIPGDGARGNFVFCLMLGFGTWSGRPTIDFAACFFVGIVGTFKKI